MISIVLFLSVIPQTLAFQCTRGPCKPFAHSSLLNMTPNKSSTEETSTTRQKFIHNIFLSSLTFTLPPSSTFLPQANAFDGGVGGLGKTKPSTGVIFANPENIEIASSISTPGDYNTELLSPDGTPAFLSFFAQWPMLKSTGIESRDLSNAESSFVQVEKLPEGKSSGSSLPKSFFVNSIFGQTGKYGMYGTPTDIKISKVRDGGSGSGDDDRSSIYLASFTTLTPAMRESDRKALIAVSTVGDGVFMLVTGTTAARFKSQEPILRKIADSFVCVEAPKSSLRR